MEPASTANIPLTFLWPWAYASMVDSSLGSSAPLATAVKLIGLPDALIASLAPSMRGWMFSEPGVAMKPTASPPCMSEEMRWPSW